MKPYKLLYYIPANDDWKEQEFEADSDLHALEMAENVLKENSSAVEAELTCVVERWSLNLTRTGSQQKGKTELASVD